MERVQFIQHKGKKILHLNFADCTADEVLTVIDQAEAAIRTQARQSVFTLTDVTNTTFNSNVSDAMKEFVIHNKPYIVASAVVGVTGLKQIIYNAVMKFSGRKLTAFDSLAEAKDWLAER
jgi:flavodoxin